MWLLNPYNIATGAIHMTIDAIKNFLITLDIASTILQLHENKLKKPHFTAASCEIAIINDIYIKQEYCCHSFTLN